MANERHLIEPQALLLRSGEPGLVVIDLSHSHHHLSHRIPGARHVDINTRLNMHRTMANCGVTKGTLVVAYDDEGGIKAAQFLWCLMVFGHTYWSLLNGGLHAWLAQRLPVESGESAVALSQNYDQTLCNRLQLDQHEVMARLGRRSVVFVDARTLAEYRGRR